MSDENTSGEVSSEPAAAEPITSENLAETMSQTLEAQHSELPPSTETAEPSSPSPLSAGQPDDDNASPPAGEVSSGVQEALTAIGIDPAQFPDDASALRELTYAYRQLQAAQPYIQYGQAVAHDWQNYQQYLSSRQQAQAPAQPAQPEPEPEPYWPKPPEWDPEWETYLAVDPQTREIVAKPGADPTLPQKRAQYLKWIKDRQADLLHDPAEAIYPGLAPKIEKMVEERLEKRLQRERRQTEAESFVQQNYSALFQPNPVTGQTDFTPQGQAFYQLIQEAEQMGIPDPTARRNYALRNLHFMNLAAQQQLAPQAPQAPADPAKANAATKANFVQRAAGGAVRKPNRSGTLATAASPNAPAQNPESLFKQMLENASREGGILPV